MGISLEKVKKLCVDLNPALDRYFNSEQKFIDYSREIKAHKFDPIHLARQKEYWQEIKKRVDELFTPEEKVIIKEPNGLLLNTSDHHGIINYPTVVGGFVTMSIDTLYQREKYGDFFVLDCGNVPLNDILHKRGFDLNDKHINLFPKKDRHAIAMRYPLYKFDFMHWAKKSENGQKLNDQEWKFIKKIQDIVDNIDFSTCKKYADQITKINYYLWPLMFDSKSRNEIRRLVPLEHDEILKRYLIKFLREKEDNFVKKILFNPELRQKLIDKFKGIYGAWDYGQEGSGSKFFWGFTKQAQHIKLDLINNTLVDKDKIIKIDFEPEALANALEKEIITPSIFTKFTIVAFYLGACAWGGPGQSEYVPKLKKAWVEFMADIDPEEQKRIESVSVENNICCDVHFSRQNGKLKKLFAFDVMYQGGFDKNYYNKVGDTALKHIFLPSMPICYYRLAPAGETQDFGFDDEELYQGFNWL